jgi:hypothetical protein
MVIGEYNGKRRRRRREYILTVLTPEIALTTVDFP